MKNKGFIIGITFVSFFTVFSNILWTQNTMGIDKAIEEANSPKLDLRQHAFGYLSQLPNSQNNDRVKMALIKILKMETEYQESLSPEQWEKLGEGYGAYLDDLFLTVDNLKDKRAIPEMIRFGKGCVGQTGLLFPEITIPLLMSSLDNLYSSEKYLKFEKDKAIRNKDVTITQEFECTFGSFKKLLAADKNNNYLTTEWKTQIRKGLLRGVNDKEPFVRLYAIGGLAEISDPEVISILKSIADNDPESFPMTKSKKYPKGKKYLVREEAQKVLDKLKAEGKIK